MNYEDAADEIVSFGISRVVDIIKDIVPNLHKYPEIWNEIPAVARPFITVKYVMSWINKINGIVHKIPKYEKYMIVAEMKKVIESLEEDYVHSVVIGDRDASISEILQNLGEMIDDGV